MNIFITFICLTFSFSLQAPGIDNTLQQSKQFLANIHTLSDKNQTFNENHVLIQAEKIKQIVENKSYSKKMRSDFLLVYSGLIGLYAKQERSGSKGKEAYDAVKESLKIYPCNHSAANAFASSLIGIDNNRWSWFVKQSLGISGNKFLDEIKQATSFLIINEHKKGMKELRKKLEQIEP